MPSDSPLRSGQSIAQSHMRKLSEFLRRAASGDDSPCPAVLDALWHRWVAFPKAYEAFCLRNFGVVIEHVVSAHARCYGRAIEPIVNDGALCRARVKVQ